MEVRYREDDKGAWKPAVKWGSEDADGRAIGFTADGKSLWLLTSQGQDVLPLALALDENGKLGFDTYDLESSETEGEIKVGVGIGGGGGGSSSSETQSDRTGLVRLPGGVFEPRICKQPSS